MEKFACEVEDVLKEQLFLFKELKNIFQKEKDCIVKIDIDSLWKTIKQKKEIGSQIAMLSERILALFEEASVQIDMGIESFSLSKAIKKIPVSDATKSDLLKLKTLIMVEQDDIKAVALTNSRHVNSYLLVIDDVFSTIMSVTDESQYKNSGSVPVRKKGNCLIRQEV
ncbi:MAG: flagellar export chaperone FlgN [Desulfobacteraceae bacterium]|nr:flagellar export chaperone FlgN [Desulfobacteraceae bacterium]